VGSGTPAKVAELADALDSGSSGVTPMEVQVLSFARSTPDIARGQLLMRLLTSTTWYGSQVDTL
jgi:hypothetical protein